MPDTLNLALTNTTNSTLYCNITGNVNGSLALIESDGKTVYYPPSPTTSGTPLAVNCTISLGAPGSTITVTIPKISASRIWFSINTPLAFLLNPGPGLVEPSVTNPSDPNINILWGFCELTFNNDQLYANISYVDFVALPIALSLTNANGQIQVVQGIPKDGLDQVCAGLQAQTASDGKGWSRLIIRSPSGQILRVLSPNLGQVTNSSLFAGYYEPYVDEVWNKYANTPLAIDSQSQFGTVQGTVQNGVFNFPGIGTYPRPSTADIFTCSTGPFQTNTAGLAALTPRISAAFNRSTLLSQSAEPSNPTTYYQNSITNHYSRILHATNLDKRGYAFPYDDVSPSGGADQSGAVFDPSPSLLAITIGGPASGALPVSAPSIDATSQIKAASFTSNNGILTQATTDTGGGDNCGWIANGDWIGFSPVDFGSGLDFFTARVASGAATGISGLVQVAIDSPTAAPVANFAVANTGGWQSWTTINAPMTTVAGVHAMYLTFASGQAQDFVNVNWFEFGSAPRFSAAEVKSPKMGFFQRVLKLPKFLSRKK